MQVHNIHAYRNSAPHGGGEIHVQAKFTPVNVLPLKAGCRNHSGRKPLSAEWFFYHAGSVSDTVQSIHSLVLHKVRCEGSCKLARNKKLDGEISLQKWLQANEAAASRKHTRCSRTRDLRKLGISLYVVGCE